MCRMQLKTNCIRQLQNGKFLVVCYDPTTEENLCPRSLTHFLHNVEFNDKQVRPIRHNKMVLQNVLIEPSWNVQEA